jgi:hypothetical protein
MFKRVSQFDVEWPTDMPEPEEPLSKLAMLDLDTLAVDEIEQILGDDLLDKFHASLKEDDAPEFLQNVITTASEWVPWWISSKNLKMVQDSSSEILKHTSEPPQIIPDLPPFQQISSIAPSEFLWNNLVELM